MSKPEEAGYPAKVLVWNNIVSSKGCNWSEGISLSTCRGRLVGLPGTSGINVAVNKRGFTTHVTISHTSHTEIFPLDVRLRLSREAQLCNLDTNETDVSHSISSKNQEAFIPFEVDNSISLINSQRKNEPHGTVNESRLYLLPSYQPSVHSNKSSSNGNNNKENRPGLEDVMCFIQGVTLFLAVEGDQACDCREVGAFVVDDFALTVQPTTHPDSDVKELLVRLTLGDIQFDNQLYSRGGYDFPVLLMTQLRDSQEQEQIEFNVNGSALTLVEMSRLKGSALDAVFTVDVTSYKSPVLQDTSLTFTSLILYVEDTYLLELKDHLLSAIPAYSLTDIQSDVDKMYSVNKSPIPVSPTHAESSVENNASGSRPNTEDNEQLGILFFNLKQHEGADDKDEELFNVSEPDLDVQGVGFIPETSSSHRNRNELPVEMKAKDVLFESELPWLQADNYANKDESDEALEYLNDIPVPREIVAAAQELASPLRLRSLTVSPLVVLVSLHTSTTFYIGLDHSPLNFSSFQRGNLLTTAYRLGHALTLHYFLGAFYGSAWALASLEMLGAPGGLARTVTSGLKDFVSLPYQGIQQGLRAFLTGIAHGSASLMRHVTAGTLTSVTKMASSWARTLDRLTLNQDDLRRTEEARRRRPQGVTQGFVHGLTEFGISLLGAMGSLVHQPLQYAISSNPEVGLVNSIGLGVMGVITRPLSGAAELVALTGEGLLSGAGWSNAPKARSQLKAQHVNCGIESLVKYSWKIFHNTEQLLLAMEATSPNDYEPVVMLLTRSNLYILHLNRLTLLKSINLSELHMSAHHSDPTLLILRIVPLEVEAEALSRTRLAQFVRDSQRVITGDHDVLSQASSVDTNSEVETSLYYFVNPELRDYFITFVAFARRHAVGRDFPLIS